jgi:elongation factor G
MRVLKLQRPEKPSRTVAVTRQAQGECRFVRQRGEPGRYGHVVMVVEPATDGAFTLEWAVDPSLVSEEYIDAVVNGIHSCYELGGPFAGCAFVRTRVRVVGGSSHAVDSNELSYEIAAARAFAQAVESGGLRDDA